MFDEMKLLDLGEGAAVSMTREQAWADYRQAKGVGAALAHGEAEGAARAYWNYCAGWDAALANSPLGQVVEALEWLMEQEAREINVPIEEWRGIPWANARAALAAAKEAMGTEVAA